MRDYEPLSAAIRRHRRFLVTTHLFPDGDGLGSALALAAGLRRLGCEAEIVVPSPVPARYAFMDPEGELRLWASDGGPAGLSGFDAAVVLDCGDLKRLAGLGRCLPDAGLELVCVDHHGGYTGFADVALLDPGAAATAEMIHELLLRQFGLEPDAVSARALYVALVTETGGFQYSNTTAKVLALASRLVELGADPDRLNVELNQRNPLGKLKLLGRALDTLALGAGGRMAWVALGPEAFAAAGATADDTIGLVDQPRSLDGVELALMFFEDEPCSVKMSFRSKRWLDCSLLARQFGGGGHPRAAGALLEMPLAEAVRRVTEAGARALEAGASGQE
jgi:phosphoesterase RecJ-like protein